MVIGLATEQYTKGLGFSFDLVNLYKPEWTPKDQELMERMQHDLGYFVNPVQTKNSIDEYPNEINAPTEAD